MVALGESYLDLTDTIAAFNEDGAAIYAENGSGGETAAITLDRTLWYPSSQTKTGTSNGGSVVKSNDFSGDPAFRNDGVHIKRISAAYGVGATARVLCRPRRQCAAHRHQQRTRRGRIRDSGHSALCVDRRAGHRALHGLSQPVQQPPDRARRRVHGRLYQDRSGGSYSGVNTQGGTTQFARIDKTVTIQGGYFARTDDNSVTDGDYTLYDWEDPHPDDNPTIIDVAVQGPRFLHHRRDLAHARLSHVEPRQRRRSGRQGRRDLRGRVHAHLAERHHSR